MNGSFIDDLRDIPGFNVLKTKGPKDQGLRVTGEDPDGDFDGVDDLKPKRERETFPCESCGGTGRYRGPRIHQPKVECFACKGKGFFYKSYKDRLASKQKRAAAKVKRIETTKTDFITAHPDLYTGMVRHSSWNEFLGRLIADLNEGKELRENAIAAAQRAVDKANDRDAERTAASCRGEAPTVNVDQLKAAFDAASRAGLKRPKLRFDGFEVSRAPDTGKNAGALYVKSNDGAYLGKIVSGKYVATREAEQAGIVARVVEAMANPFELAKAYGARTGNCSCCGRKLTDKQSVANGIGPVCAEKYGWANEAPAGSDEDLAAGITAAKIETAAVPARATKYEYAPGMSDADKRKLRADARRSAK